MKESPLLDEFGQLTKHRLDIQDLVDRSRSLLVVAQPFVQLIKFFKMLFCWEHKLATFSLMMTFNIVGTFISEFGLLMLLGTLSSSIVLLSFSHYRYHSLKKVLPAVEPDAEYNMKSHAENMRDFRILLALMEKAVIQTTNIITKFYSFIKWEDLNLALKFHILFFSAFLVLIIFPLRFFLLFTLDVILLLYPVVKFFNEPSPGSCPSPIKDLSETETPCFNPLDKSEQNTSEPITETSDLQGDGSLATDSECSERLADDTDDDAPQDVLLNPHLVQPQQLQHAINSVETNPAEKVNLPVQAVKMTTKVYGQNQTPSNKNVLNQKVPIIVEKIMEFKKRAKNFERCFNCGAVFTAILKRRHICNSCGNHYCYRCCSHKVPRSRFGATAPAAQTETVAVCSHCLRKLDKDKSA